MASAASRTITIVEHDAGWAQRYQAERARVEEILRGSVVAIEHVGSTAVAGLAAKPVIDLVVVVDGRDQLAASARRLGDGGPFVWRPEYADVDQLGAEALPSREFLHRDGADGRECNVHMYAEGDPEIERHLLFRDWLRRDAADRAAYQELKRQLAARHEDVNAYAHAKGGFIRAAEERALQAQERADGRRVEVGASLAASAADVWPLLRTPDGLERWYASHATAEGSEIALQFDEEYGYSVHRRGRIVQEHPGRSMQVRWHGHERSFEGQLASTGEQLRAGARWTEPPGRRALELDVRVLREGGGSRVLVAERGFGTDIDATQQIASHSSWWHHHLGARLPDVAGGRADARWREVVQLDAPPARTWQVLTTTEAPAEWRSLPHTLGSSRLFDWAGGRVRASLQSLVSRRLLRCAWHAPGVPGTVLEFRLQACDSGMGTRFEVTHGGWPLDGGPGRVMQLTQAAWKQAIDRLAQIVNEEQQP